MIAVPKFSKVKKSEQLAQKKLVLGISDTQATKNPTKLQTSVLLFGCLKSIYKRSLVEGEESRVSQLMGKSITENC